MSVVKVVVAVAVSLGLAWGGFGTVGGSAGSAGIRPLGGIGCCQMAQ